MSDSDHIGTFRRQIAGISPFEDTIGFSRALWVGERVFVSGTGPVWPDGTVPPSPELQARRCFELIDAALREAGGGLGDVVRTRMFITDAAHATAVGAVHGELFATVRPAATMVIVAGLLDERWVVEVEAEAILKPTGSGSPGSAPPSDTTVRGEIHDQGTTDVGQMREGGISGR
jgi:enamine deaminase RidA (YjgF/YER057c/UK114 family)